MLFRISLSTCLFIASLAFTYPRDLATSDATNQTSPFGSTIILSSPKSELSKTETLSIIKKIGPKENVRSHYDKP